MDDSFRLLTRLYKNSKVSAAVIDLERGEVWKNKLFSAIGEFENYTAEDILGDDPKDQIKYLMLEKRLLTLNVMALKKDRIAVVEVIGDNSAKSIFSFPAVKKYLLYIFEKIRGAISDVTVASGELHALMQSGIETEKRILEEKFSTIESGMMSLLHEMLRPEQLTYILNDGMHDKTVYLTDEMSRIYKNLNDLLGGHIKTESEIEKGLFAVCEITVLEGVISAMLSGIMGEDRYFPRLIALKAGISENGKIKILAETEGESNVPRKLPDRGDSMFYEYICEEFCRKYNGVLTRTSSDGRTGAVLELPAASDLTDMSSPLNFSSGGVKCGLLALKIGTPNIAALKS